MIAAEELRRVPLFGGLSDAELEVLLAEGEEKLVPAGEVNGREGEPVEHLYVILSGELRITKNVDGGEIVINVYTPGSFFAEVPLLAGSPFMATGRAITPCRMFLIPEAAFRRMLMSNPAFSHAILRTMAQRVQILQSIAGQREKLNSLGTLSAGLAHELNNPASASRRAVEELRGSVEKLKALSATLGRALTPEQLAGLRALEAEASDAAKAHDPFPLDPLAAGDLEDGISAWCEGRGVEAAWDLSPTFAGAGLSPAWLEEAARGMPAGVLPDVLAYLEAAISTSALLREAEGGTARVSDIVGAMKSYSSMDRAPLQEVDVNAGLDTTVAVLGHKLGGVEIVRDYDPMLPRVTAHEGELNQVWTALIDNAADAVADGEPGQIRLRTTCEGDRVLVEVADNGPGVPEELRGRVFEPFFSTKEVGSGSGLGLDASYRVIVGRHGGDIRVEGGPGDTRFQVRIPTSGPTAGGAPPDVEWALEAGR